MTLVHSLGICALNLCTETVNLATCSLLVSGMIDAILNDANSRARTRPFYSLPSRLKDYKETESKICVHEYCIPLTTMEIINYKSYRWKESIFLQHLFCSSTIGFAISHG